MTDQILHCPTCGATHLVPQNQDIVVCECGEVLLVSVSTRGEPKVKLEPIANIKSTPEIKAKVVAEVARRREELYQLYCKIRD